VGCRVVRTVLAAAAVFGVSACTPYGPPPGATAQGRAVFTLWTVFLWTGAGVAAIVYALIFWSILRYRRRSDRLPPQFAHNTVLEIVYTTIPVLIVAGLFALTFRTEAYIDRVPPAADPAVTIHVTAFQWSWRFDYEGTGVSIIGTPDQPPQVVVPTGRTIRLILTSPDVAHALWVPQFLFKRDAIPGITNRFDLDVQTPGTYFGECAEFCGLDHTRMQFTVRAVPPDEFQRWLRRGGSGGHPS
jgi:cytochrome c oxidase subunit II